jgi:hypothetical protein
MTYEKIALLRTLAGRPSRDISPTVQLMLGELLAAGYVAHDEASGWSATAAGCRAVEDVRQSSLRGHRR